MQASAVQAASDTSTDDLAALIASRETELARLFEPGKPQPRAATVAALRKDIANLRGRLNAGLGVERPQLGSSVTSPTAATPSSILSVPGPASPSAIASSGRVLNALKLVEAQLAVSRQADTVAITDLSLEQQQLLLRLQDDNVALKAKLDVVLARQAQLQWLVEQHVGSTAAGTGGSNSSKAIEWDTPAAVAAAEPHAMHTAAC